MGGREGRRGRTWALGRSRRWEGLVDDDVGRAFDRAHVEVAILPT